MFIQRNSKTSKMTKHFISIITVNLNNLNGLKKTIESVLDQNNNRFEFIIIDGGSEDGSREYIEQNKKRFDFWCSAPDNGIYDAMNKGIDQANGQYLLFLNSGDYLVNESVLRSFFELDPKEDVIYGNSLLKDGENYNIKVMPEINSLIASLSNTINHQTIFYKRSLFANGNRYRTEFKIVADWVFLNDILLNKKATIKHIDLIIPCFDVNGISGDKISRIEEKDLYIKSTFDEHFNLLYREYNSLLYKNEKLHRELHQLNHKHRKVLNLRFFYNAFFNKLGIK